jgi:hypothetical protein
MLKKLFTTIFASTMALFLVTACAEEGKDAGVTAVAKTESTTEKAVDTSDQGDSAMNQPVDFSTPEKVEKSLQNVREKDGDAAYNSLKNTLQYLQVYDLSVGNSKEKLYKKLDGKTPEQIMAKVKR